MLEAREVAPTVGPYRLEARIGSAGGAEVWIARRTDERSLNAALKLIKSAGEGPFATFREELRAAQSLAHPGLVPVFDFGDSEHGFYIASELVDGPSLAALIERLSALKSPLPPATIAFIGMRASEALGYAMSHASIDGLSIRLVHRHLSPANLLIDLVGHVRVVDLGVLSGIANTSPSSGRVVRGNPAYLAPEQIRDEPIDQRVDLFALGAVLYHCATFQQPFPGSDPKQIMEAVLHREPRQISDVVPGFPAAIAQIIHECLNKDPLLRPANSGEVRGALIEAASTIGGTADAPMALGRAIAAAFPRGDYPQAAARRGSKVDRFEAPTKLIDEPTQHDATESEDTIEKPPPDRVVSVAGAIYPKTAVTTEILPTNVSSPPTASAAVAHKETNGAGPRREIVEKTTSTRSDPAIPAVAVSSTPLSTDGLPGAKPSTDPAPASPKAAVRATSAPVVPIIHQPPPGEDWLQKLSDVLEDPRRGKLIALGFGVVIVLLLGALISSRTSSSFDEELRRLYEVQDYERAERYFVEHSGRFNSPEAAFELASDARMRKLGLPLEALARGAQQSEKLLEKTVEPELKEIEIEEPVAGEDKPAGQETAAAVPPVAGKVEHDLSAPAEIPAPPAKNKADKKIRARAIKIEQFGQRMVAEGNLAAAEESFAKCLEIREHPGCHLRLALLMLDRGDRKQAAVHLGRYTLLYPEDPQVDQIKKLILALEP